jgi:hypothetical protein
MSGQEVVKGHDRFWLHNGESRGTRPRRGPSLLQRLTAAWCADFLSGGGGGAAAGWGGGAAGLEVAAWLEALSGEDPDFRAETPEAPFIH